MNDFRKYATQHLGMSGMVLDDVVKLNEKEISVEDFNKMMQE